MARLRVRVELNKGRIGIPLAKLASVVDEIHRFFGKICEDVNVEASVEDWLALHFEEGSLAFDIENPSAVDDSSVTTFNRTLKRIGAFTASAADDYSDIPRATLLQYATIAKSIDADEKVIFGLYSEGEDQPGYRYELTKNVATDIEHYASKPEQTEYYGGVHGVIYSLVKEADRPFLNIRDLNTQKLIKCFYKKDMYEQIVGLLKKKEAVVYVYGLVRANRNERKIESIKADKFKISDDFSDKDFQDFFGCASDLTGELSTEDFISRIREDAH
jgi:hypothetical protein